MGQPKLITQDIKLVKIDDFKTIKSDCTNKE